METFDDISCEEYYSVYGDEREQFEAWVRDMEADCTNAINQELRELAAK